ncbi:glutathione S-transferase T3-like [Salvia hispanica]|uniref:glutathione S-transferase T3-like n=1 Tax=Salvia hispanica TaxID=49212 RepID=UPI0020096834|nr:glutathione S-transferase T3-like [Salvia hispanica]
MPRRKRATTRLWGTAAVIHTAKRETLALYGAWISVSYDPVVGNQQTHLYFWKKFTEVYNARRPKKTFARNVKMLRSHWDRCDKDVKNFCGIYRAEEANYQSWSRGADILRAALRFFKDDVGKDFKHVEVWSHVHHLERWVGGVESGSGSKRTKHTARGHYSSSDGGEGSTSQEDTPTDDAEGSSGSRRRPQGTKAAKAARAKGRGRRRGRGESRQVGLGSGSNTLMSMYLLATMVDT